MLSIYKREVKAYYFNMPGYIFAAFLLLITGIIFAIFNLKGLYPDFEPVLSFIGFVFLLIVPIVTMRSVAEDRGQKTDQLLYSLPLSVWKIILGKFLALCTIFILPVLVVCLYPLILSMFGTVNFFGAYGAVIGFVLLGCALMSIGMFISSLTESQVIAAVISFAVMLVLYLMNMLIAYVPSTATASLIALTVLILLFGAVVYFMTKDLWIGAMSALLCETVLMFFYMQNKSAFNGLFARVLGWVSVFDRFNPFVSGIFDISAVVYYLSVTCVFVFLTVQSFERRRWS